jgi:hypothetical protein
MSLGTGSPLLLSLVFKRTEKGNEESIYTNTNTHIHIKNISGRLRETGNC